MSRDQQLARLLRWYPASWRSRYGEELTALLEDTHGQNSVPWRVRISLAKSGSLERARAAGLMGDSTGSSERIRAGSLLILCAWALFMVAGTIFAKFSEQWSSVTPRPDRWLPSMSYDTVEWAGIVGVLLVGVAATLVAPAFLLHIRGGGWESVRRPILRAIAVGVLVLAMTAGVVVWANQSGQNGRNGASLPFSIFVGVWGITMAASLTASTAAAVSVARRLDIHQRILRMLGRMAIALTIVMAVVIAGTLIWWESLATYAPSFLGSGPLSVSNVVPPPMVAAGLMMLAGLVLGLTGARSVVRALRAPSD